MNYFPFCGVGTEICRYEPFIFVLIVVLAVIAYFVYQSWKKSSALESFGYTVAPGSAPVSPLSVKAGQGETETKVDAVEAEPEPEKEPTIGEVWLKDNDLPDDTFGAILLDYCGMRHNKVAVTIIDIDFENDIITIALRFPRVDVVKFIELNINEDHIRIDEELDLGAVMADVFIEDDYADSSPDYNTDEEIALDGVNWSEVADNLIIQLYMSSATVAKIFPAK